MQTPPLSDSDLRKLPKIELHRHLDGSVRFNTVKELIKQHNLDIKFSTDEELFNLCKIQKPMTNLTDVLNFFWTMQKVMCDYHSIKRIAYENVEDCYYDGIVLSELRFAPTFIAQNKKISYEDIIKAVIDGALLASKTFKVPVGLIFIAPRTLPFEENVKALIEFIRFKNSNVEYQKLLVGFDLASEESDAYIDQYKEMVEMASVNGLQITIHSGEETSAKHMEKTIRLYSPSRIGHGIRCVEDESVMNLIKERNIHLEVCPTSNYLTQCVKTLKDHPIRQIYDYGISCSLNSDDPQLMNIDLVNEYIVGQNYFDFSASDFKKMNDFALAASFLPQDIKEKIKL